ncbi:MAG: hypothetical protein ACTS3F_04850 [Phycisphaerales bacterium]
MGSCRSIVARSGLTLAGVILSAAITGHASAGQVVQAGAQNNDQSRLASSGLEAIRNSPQTRLVQSGAPTVLRSFRPREGALQTPAPADANRVMRLGAGSRGASIIMADESTAIARHIASSPDVAARIAGSLTPDSRILIQADAGDVQPLIAISPNQLLDDRYLDQFRRDHPYITEPQALRARDAMIAGRAQWQRETGLKNRVMRFENTHADRIYSEDETTRAVIHEPSAIIVPRGQGLMSNAYPTGTHTNTVASYSHAYHATPAPIVVVRSSSSCAPAYRPHYSHTRPVICSPCKPIARPVCIDTCRDRFRSSSGISISFSSGGSWGYDKCGSWRSSRSYCAPRYRTSYYRSGCR